MSEERLVLRCGIPGCAIEHTSSWWRHDCGAHGDGLFPADGCPRCGPARLDRIESKLDEILRRLDLADKLRKLGAL